MDTWVDYLFGWGWLTFLLSLAFGVGAGIMWIFHNWLGFNPNLVAGCLAAGYAFNALSKLVRELEFKEHKA